MAAQKNKNKNKELFPHRIDKPFTPGGFWDEYGIAFNKAKLERYFDYFDKFYQAGLAKITAGVSPASIQMDFFSWFAQLLQNPGHVMKLASYPLMHYLDLISDLITPFEGSQVKRDVRFQNDHWQYLPWRAFAEGFVEVEKWWHDATTNVMGLPEHAERSVTFIVRQILDALAPSNFVLTNPELFYETIRTNGYNLIRGTELALEHGLRRYTGAPPPGADQFIPGKQVAVTPGRVVYQNHLIELIQYEPATKMVYQEPILIIPAWIMKYYILDLSPENSLVKYLVSQGHTVFMISWRNPDSGDRDLGMDDYFRKGAMAAIDAVSTVLPDKKINLMGYCLGGTLAIITAAMMSRENDNRLKSLTLLAAQADFTDAGELMLFINESQLNFLENLMWQQGYLDTKQMAGAFQVLRTYDLIWSKMVQDYMHGRERGTIDLLAWNADSTRMPFKMHSEYLERLFLNNDLARGHFSIEGKPIAADNIRIPAFIVSTEKDHVAPWKSVYKLHLLLGSPSLRFLLANGGHNAGIVSEPGRAGRYYRVHEAKSTDSYIDSTDWLSIAQWREGSWWLCLEEWLKEHSSAKEMPAKALDESLPAAPGSYVFQK